MVNDTTPLTLPQMRAQTHCKLLTYREQQAVVFLSRDDSGALTVIVSVWSAADDHQLRAALDFENDEQAQASFDAMDDAIVGKLLDDVSIDEILEGSPA